MYGYIYKTTNSINNKIYIGQHKSSVFDKSYIGSGNMLRLAINKYGIDNFECEILEWCSDKESLNKAEIYWINYYNSYDHKIGYNIAQGGTGGNLLLYMEKEDIENRNNKISNSLLNHKVSKETRLKFSAAKKRWNMEHPGKQSEINKLRYLDGTLNKTISNSQKERFKNNPKLKEDVSDRLKDLWKDEEYREKQSNSRSSEEYKNLMTEKLKGKTLGYKFINDGHIMKRVPEDKLDEYLSNGWVLGQLPFSDEHRLNISKGKKGKIVKTNTAIEIMCITTNEVFSSKKEAANKLGLSLYLIDKSLRLNIEVNGFLFKKVNS